MENLCLAHHGVKGMRWGVRRYQNYDGSYTQAGLKRYKNSLYEYNRQVDRVNNLKKSGANKSSITNAEVSLTKAKRRMNKDYKHLKQDKLGDKGKKLYAKGYTINGKKRVLRYMTKIGGLTLSAAAAAKTDPNDNTIFKTINKYNKAIVTAGAALTTAGVAGQAVTYNKDRKLRAYYKHTSNY